MMKDLIVVPTHSSGIKFLENLFASFNGYGKYPILVVINDYKDKDEPLFENVIKKFRDLPMSLERVETNSFELGGLYAALKRTDYDEFFLLSHSCEIVNVELFDIIFDRYKNRSVAFGVQTGNWNGALGKRRENERFILKHLDKELHSKLLRMGDIKFWQGHIGKYRRAILEKINLEDYLPMNMVEAISISELLFTNTYHSLDPSTVVLFPDWRARHKPEEKFGKIRVKIANEYIIKWTTHSSPQMVYEDMKSRSLIYKYTNILRKSFGGELRKIKRSLTTFLVLVKRLIKKA